jgi:RimJ/RimL family protein N-acetyltransferase
MKEEIKNWIIQTTKNNSCLYFSIFLSDPKIYIGHIGLKEIDKIKKQAEIGIVIGEKEYWRKGIGTIAFLKLLEKVKKLKLRKIFAKIDKDNTASIKFFSKLGFKKSTKEEKGLIILVYQL